MKKVLIAGGSGLVGKNLKSFLLQRGYEVAILTQNKDRANGKDYFYWNIKENAMDETCFRGVSHIIQLAGANIAGKRWSLKRKKEIIDSRVESTLFLYRYATESKTELQSFITASAIGYYGAITGEKIFSEEDEAAKDFLGETCRVWEEAADRFSVAGIRTVKLRIGIVLSKKDGALEKMILPTKLGVGSATGSGKQFMPWIHIDDLCGIFLKVIEDRETQGAYNAVSPDHKTNAEFMKSLAFTLNKPFWFPKVPSFLMKLLFGEMSCLMLEGSRISSIKICRQGYVFKYPELNEAIKNLLC